jgi:hypothetical protein
VLDERVRVKFRRPRWEFDNIFRYHSRRLLFETISSIPAVLLSETSSADCVKFYILTLSSSTCSGSLSGLLLAEAPSYSIASHTRSDGVPSNKAFLYSQSFVIQPSLHSIPRLIRAARTSELEMCKSSTAQARLHWFKLLHVGSLNSNSLLWTRTAHWTALRRIRTREFASLWHIRINLQRSDNRELTSQSVKTMN